MKIMDASLDLSADGAQPADHIDIGRGAASDDADDGADAGADDGADATGGADDDATGGAEARRARRPSGSFRGLAKMYALPKAAHAQAQYYVLQYQFKRVHKLTHVKSFTFLEYLSKALRGHIIHIIEPSKKT